MLSVFFLLFCNFAKCLLQERLFFLHNLELCGFSFSEGIVFEVDEGRWVFQVDVQRVFVSADGQLSVAETHLVLVLFGELEFEVDGIAQEVEDGNLKH